MINISYNYILNGPGKVVTNLLTGLEKAGIVYKINQVLEKNDKLLILQDTDMILQGSNDQKIIGPNICTLPIDNQYVMSQNYKKIIVPSEWVKQLYMKWLPENKILTWAVGIDTEVFYDMSNDIKNNDCLIYFKRRCESELISVISILNSINQSYQIVKYGKYSESEFLKHLSNSRYGIIIDRCESQGIAIEEIMSANLPLLVWDTLVWDDRGEEFKVDATSVPYWDDMCGIKVSNLNELKRELPSFISNLKSFNPRSFIINNLSLDKCSKKLYDEFLKY